MKTCPKCKQSLELTREHWRIQHMKVSAYCIPCTRQYARDRYHRLSDKPKRTYAVWGVLRTCKMCNESLLATHEHFHATCRGNPSAYCIKCQNEKVRLGRMKKKQV